MSRKSKVSGSITAAIISSKPYLSASSLAALAIACGGVVTPEGTAHQTESAVTTRTASVDTILGAASTACSTATVDGGWITGDLGRRTGTFTVEFDATAGTPSADDPSTHADDALFGLSSGPASHYTDLAAIARFNPAGTIDARNGGSYGADNPVPYHAGVVRHLRLDVNVVTHTYSVRDISAWTPYYSQLYGASPVATNFAFRTEQAMTSVLDHFALKVDAAGPLGVCNVTVDEPGQCGVAIPSGGFVNRAFHPEAVAFKASFTATPAANGIDGVVGLSAAPAEAFNDLAAAIRFNPDGLIDVRNGGAYTADTSVPYVSGKAYAFGMDVDVARHTYSVSVDGTLIASDYAFRSQQSTVSSLANLAIITDSATGPATACDFVERTKCQSYSDCAGSTGDLCSYDYTCRQACDCTQCCDYGQMCGWGDTHNDPPGEDGHGTCR